MGSDTMIKLDRLPSKVNIFLVIRSEYTYGLHCIHSLYFTTAFCRLGCTHDTLITRFVQIPFIFRSILCLFDADLFDNGQSLF